MSLDQINPLLINTVAGAATGYITNNYAVKMLFRKYGPFGGVLLATKEKFVESMANLVERDIINAQTLANNFHNAETQKVLYKIIRDTTKKHLYNNAPNIPLQSVEGIPSTINNLLEVYQQQSPELINNLLKIFLDKTIINSLLPEKQGEKLVDSIFELLFNEIKNTFAAEKLVQNFYAQNQEKNLGEFIPPEIFIHLTENLAKNINSNQEKSVRLITAEISDELLEKIFVAIDLEKLFSEFIEQYKNKNLYELLGKDNLASIWQDFIAHIASTLQSVEGQILVKSAVDNIFIALKNVEVSIFALLEDGLRAKLLNFLQAHLPALIEMIIVWFQENKNSIEQLINFAIDDVLNQTKNDLFGKAKKFLKDAMYENVAGKQELIAKMIYAIQNDLDIDTVSEEISDYILQYLQTNSISELVTKLENSGMITKNDLVMLINTFFNNYSKNPDLKILESFLACPLGEIVDFSVKQNWYKYFEKFCRNCVGKYSWQDHLLTQLSGLPEKNISELCSLEQSDNFAQAGQMFLLDQLRKNKNILSEKLHTIILKFTAGKSMASILPTIFSQTTSEKLAFTSEKYLAEFMQSPELGNVHTVFDKLNQNEKIGKLAPAVSIKLLQRNLDTLLSGNVSIAVQNNLSALPDEELQSIVENFMGKELGPINIIGAVMGAVAGAGCYALGLANLSPSLWLNAISSAAVFGLIGYTTNVLAIKMIFRPYKEWQVQNITVPCTPGIIAKQKPRFAKSMAEFIDESLLNKEKLQGYFQNKRLKMENSLHDLFTRDNFQLFKDFTQSNLSRLGKQLLLSMENSLGTKKDFLATNLQNILDKQSLQDQDLRPLENFLQSQKSSAFVMVEQLATEKLSALLTDKKTLQDCIALDYKEQAVQNIIRQQCQDFVQLINDHTRLENICQTYQPYFEQLSEKPLKNIFVAENYVEFKQKVQNHLQEKLQAESTKQSLANVFGEKVFIELKKGKTISELFDGKISSLLEAHAPKLLDFITQRGLSILQAQRTELKNVISKKAEQEHSFLFHALDVGSTISAIVDNFLDDKLLAFVNEKEDELLQFVLRFINNDLSLTKSQDLGLLINPKSLEKVVAKIVDSTNIHNFLDFSVAIMLDLVFARPVQDVLKVTDIKTLADVYQRLVPELKTVQSNLAQNISQQEVKLVQIISPLAINILDRTILTIPLDELTTGIELQSIEKLSYNIFNGLEKSDCGTNIFDDYLDACSKSLQQKELKNFLDTELLSQSIITAGENLFTDKTTKKLLLENLSSTLAQINFEQVMATESKEYLARLISKSFLDALSNNFLELLLAMKIKEISHAQIDNMSPEEIEKMFYSFAAPYFSKVEMYGGAAAIFGMALAPLLK